MRTALTTTILVLLLALSSPAYGQQPEQRVNRFDPAIEAFIEADRTNPPPRNSILFIGSSIFRLWAGLKSDMDPLPVFNRAFGGSRTSDILRYMDRIVIPYEPKIIVYYCGSNDINADQKPADIAGRFRSFAERVHSALPGTRIFFVSINRAPQKMDKWDLVDQANRLISEICESDPKLQFIDVNPVLFDAGGTPRLDLYLNDKLHFKDPAYRLFTGIIKPIIENAWQEVQK